MDGVVGSPEPRTEKESYKNHNVRFYYHPTVTPFQSNLESFPENSSTPDLDQMTKS